LTFLEKRLGPNPRPRWTALEARDDLWEKECRLLGDDRLTQRSAAWATLAFPVLPPLTIGTAPNPHDAIVKDFPAVDYRERAVAI
jgi:hypothetical protein